MLSRFLIAALLCTVTHALVVSEIVPWNGEVRIDNSGLLDQWPYMTITYRSFSPHVTVYCSMKMPGRTRPGLVKEVLLDRQDLITALMNNEQGGEEAKQELLLRSGRLLIVDKTLEKADKKVNISAWWSSLYRGWWLRYHGFGAPIYTSRTATIANLINKVCTHLLDRRPYIAFLPIGETVIIQYPDLTSQKFLRREIPTADILAMLMTIAEAGTNTHFAVETIRVYAALQLDESQRRSWPRRYITMHWSHHNDFIRLKQMLPREEDPIREALAQILGGSLRAMPIYFARPVTPEPI